MESDQKRLIINMILRKAVFLAIAEVNKLNCGDRNRNTCEAMNLPLHQLRLGVYDGIEFAGGPENLGAKSFAGISRQRHFPIAHAIPKQKSVIEIFLNPVVHKNDIKVDTVITK